MLYHPGMFFGVCLYYYLFRIRHIFGSKSITRPQHFIDLAFLDQAILLWHYFEKLLTQMIIGLQLFLS